MKPGSAGQNPTQATGGPARGFVQDPGHVSLIRKPCSAGDIREGPGRTDDLIDGPGGPVILPDLGRSPSERRTKLARQMNRVPAE
jgi:hypothetical protein